jgi:hypothetical protein
MPMTVGREGQAPQTCRHLGMQQPCLAITNRYDGTAARALGATAVRIAGREPVALDRGLPGDGFLGFGGLLVDAVQGSLGPTWSRPVAHPKPSTS